MARQANRVRVVPGEHRRIADAIRDKDPARADSEMQTHIWSSAVVCIEAARLEVERLGQDTRSAVEETG